MQPSGILYAFSFSFLALLLAVSSPVAAQLQIDTILTTPVTCFGGDDGEAEVFFSGGTEPFTILWSDGQTDTLATHLEPGIYSVTITDALGAEAIDSAEVAEPPLMTMTADFVFPVCPNDETGSITIDPSGGVPPYTIYWNNSQTGPVLSNVAAGIYFVFVIDQQGCVLSQMFELTGTDEEPPAITASPVFLYLDETGEISLTPELLNIQASDNCELGGINIDPPVVTCENAGVNMVTVSAVDLSGNASSAEVAVTLIDTIPPVLPSETLYVQLGADGTVTVDPEDLATNATDNCDILFFEVTPDVFDCENVVLNQVLVTVTDQSGNSSSVHSYVFVEDKLPPVVLTKNITVSLDSDGQASIVADQVDDGSYDNCGFTTKQVTPSHFTCDDAGGAPVEVILKVTDLHGNSSTASAWVTVADDLPPAITCPGDVSIPFCGPVAYDFPTATDNCSYDVDQTQGLPSGAIFPFGTSTQVFEASDPSGNTEVCSFTVTVENDFLVELSIQKVSCFGGSDGSVTLAVTGGLPPYAYFWSSGGNTNLPAGTYYVTIYDSNGCESIRPFSITEPAELQAQVTGVFPENNGQQNGGFTLLVTGGTPPYVFEGTTFSDTLEASGYSAGNYSITLTDQNGCQTTVDLTIEEASGTDEPEMLRRFAVFPNPAKDHVAANVRLDQPARMQLSLTDFTGKTLRAWPAVETVGHTFHLELDGLPAGLYTLVLQLDGGELVVGRKMVIGD